MDDLLSEKEQIEEIRKWWKENGAWVVGGLVLGLSLLVGWNSWQSHVKTKAEQASSLFEQVRVQAMVGNADAASELTGRLRTEFASTPYAEEASLVLAKLLVEQGSLEPAVEALEFVVASKDDPQLVLVARMRLAQVKLQQGEFDAAVEILQVEDAGAFSARYSELRGDIAVARGDWATARSEYETAISDLGAGLVNRELVEIKLNDLPQVDLTEVDSES